MTLLLDLFAALLGLPSNPRALAVAGSPDGGSDPKGGEESEETCRLA